NSEGLEAGATVDVALQRDKVELENSLSITGSHDPLIDEASDLLIRQSSRTYVVSSHVGSMGAIMALRAGETALGGIHLLDAESGEYNKAYVRQYFPDGGVTLIRCVIRQQGLMVKKGNPENIHSVRDLIGKKYVNRQKGAGTRILLDYLLEKEGMTPDDIYGYTREEYTHTAVAAAVADGGADAGMGIYSAAKTYDLDFVPLWDEEYDFLVRNSALETPEVQRFLAVLKSDEFAARLTEMGGYTLEAPGEVIPV
ncbi:MAG: substrate-binding domain-containing protein, partial [Acutalibacteraceae bacterium]|nr:substrate-binding domain-containing protein [Acutalibacteraceae bacterium]